MAEQEHNVHVRFLHAELDLSLTLADFARAANDPATAERNRANARTGYDTVLHFYGRCGIYQEAERVELDRKLEELRQRLEVLDQRFSQGKNSTQGSEVKVELLRGPAAKLQAEADAARTLARLTSLLENTTDCVLVLDRDWRCCYLNTRARRQLAGFRDLRGMSLWEIFPEAVGTLFWHEYHLAMAEQTPIEFEEYYAPHGVWYEVHAYPSANELTIFFRDVTDRRLALEALLESELRFRTLASMVPEMLFTAQPDGRCDYLNPRFAEYTGLPETELLGSEWYTVLHPDDLERSRPKWRTSVETGEPLEIECRFRRADGVYRWFLCRGLPMRARTGEIVKWFGVSTDIDDQKRTEALIRDSEQTIRALLDSASQGIVAIDSQGKIVIFNATAERLFGYSQEEALGRSMEILLPEGLRSNHQQHQDEYLNHPRSRTMGTGQELLGRRKDGSLFPVEISLSYSPTSEGPLAVAFIADVTVRRQFEELQRSNALLLRSNSELERFASSISHDLKEPLATVRSYADLTLQRHGASLPPEVVRCLTITCENMDRMNALVTHLLQKARLGGRQLREATPLECALSWAMANLDAMVTESGVSVEYSALPVVMADPNQMAQLFQNLLSNSIKYRQEPPLRISVSAEQVGDFCTICFRDNGRGFPQEAADRIFDRYERLNPEEIPGSGLGLATCRRIVEAHGGHIWAESSPGQGATFFFTLPATDLCENSATS